MPCTPVPPVPPLIEKAGTQLQNGQVDRQTRAPLTPRRTVFLVGQCHRKTNPYQCSIAVDTSSDDMCWHISFNAYCSTGRRVNLAKEQLNDELQLYCLWRTGYECTSRRIGQGVMEDSPLQLNWQDWENSAPLENSAGLRRQMLGWTPPQPSRWENE